VQLTDNLAATVAALEIHCAEVFARPVPKCEQLEKAIRKTWLHLITDAQSCNVSPQVDYVASLYDQLTTEASIADPGKFNDHTDIPWLEFYTDGCGDEPSCEDAWVIAELFWGGYVTHLHLTLGWLLINAIRIQRHLPTITPSVESIDQFTNCLRGAGPDTFDAESLRALFGEYERLVAS
jgi:hypothetical protein